MTAKRRRSLPARSRCSRPRPDGLVNLTVASVEAERRGSRRDVPCLRSVANMPVTGPATSIWRHDPRTCSYKGVEMELPGSKFAVGDFSMDGFKVRQPKHSFAPLLDAMMAHPERCPARTRTRRRRRGAGRPHVGVLHRTLQRDGREGPGERHRPVRDSATFISPTFRSTVSANWPWRVSAARSKARARCKIGRLAFGGMKFPDPELLRSAIRSAGQPNAAGDARPRSDRSLIPKLGFVGSERHRHPGDRHPPLRARQVPRRSRATMSASSRPRSMPR